MCGIAGLLDAHRPPAEREEAVQRIVQRQAHRGPDSRGFYSDGPVTLGMCRLAIFDPAQGLQPMHTPDGRFHIVFNGAIYNFAELRRELEALGWSFRTDCDTEVLLAAYAQWGQSCLPRLRGMFAFAVWDSVERTLVVARDPFGIKPLYYARTVAGQVVFASELNGLLASRVVAPEIDLSAVGDYLAWFSVPAPRTIYRGVSNLPPGYLLELEANGSCVIRRWWRRPAPRPELAAGSEVEFRAGLRAQLDDTIRAHQLADVPVGAFLSGGLDSTSIVGLMSRRTRTRLKTFSLIFDEAAFSEQDAAQLAAQRFGTEHHEFVLRGTEVARDLPRILDALDQPTGDGVNTFYVSQLARAGGVRVVLSGLGGDEIFGGYSSFEDMPRLAHVLPIWHRLPRRFRHSVLKLLRGGSTRRQKLADMLTHARDLHELCSLRRRVLSEPARRQLLGPEARLLADRQGPNHPVLDEIVFDLATADPNQIVSEWEMRTYMADVLLRDSDVLGMAHSLELRVPFVDRPLLEWWWNQPERFRYTPGLPKRALSDAVDDVVPLEIRRRRKQGFALPFPVWMRRDLRPFLEETFSSASLARCPWLDASAVQRQWAAFIASDDPQSWSRLWTVAILVAFANRRTSAP
jgi:asparagine synthase (glutamine-hydrolysing)